MPEITTLEALDLLRSGSNSIEEWNRRREVGNSIASLHFADLGDADLSEADLSKAMLSFADLSHAKLSNANLSFANLSNADLSDADLSNANLTKADLRNADLVGAKFFKTELRGAKVYNALFGSTTLADCDLSTALGLNDASHHGPSEISVNSLIRSGGKISEEFLAGCGFNRWQRLEAILYNPDLTPLQIAELQNDIFAARTEGPIFIGGLFVSYSHVNAKFVDKLRNRLRQDGANVWVDRHDAEAGPLRRQVVDHIRLNDVVVVVLSKSSVKSNWVEFEIKKALQKEVDEGREVLCPVALDDAWKERLDEPIWEEVPEKNVLDFSKWKTKAFEVPYEKLLRGIKKYYPPKATPK